MIIQRENSVRPPASIDHIELDAALGFKQVCFSSIDIVGAGH
jgi:hypothetical protein